MYVELFLIRVIFNQCIRKVFCLYIECINLVKFSYGYFGDWVDLNVWKSKDEIFDVLFIRLMYND